MIGVQSADSGGMSGTGETPQERGFRDEEAHRPPHGKRPLGTEINLNSFLSWEMIIFVRKNLEKLLLYKKSNPYLKIAPTKT